MRIGAAIEGNLNEIMTQERDAATRGVRVGVEKATNSLKSRLRSRVQQAGLGSRLAKTWQSKFYPDEGLNAAGLVFSKAEQIIQAHTQGTVIRARNGRFLAIPTPEAVRLAQHKVGRRTKLTPRNWPSNLSKLRYVPRPRGPHLLVIDDVKFTKAGRLTKAKRTKTGKLSRGTTTVVMFFLVRQIRLKKRLDPQRDFRRVEALLPTFIKRAYR